VGDEHKKNKVKGTKDKHKKGGEKGVKIEKHKK